LLDHSDYTDLLATVSGAAGVHSAVPFRGGEGQLELVRRRGEAHSYVFIINHADAAATVEVSGLEMITGVNVQNQWQVPAGAVRVVREALA